MVTINKRIVSLALTAAAVRMLMAAPAGENFSDKIREFISDGRLVTATINFQFGKPEETPPVEIVIDEPPSAELLTTEKLMLSLTDDEPEDSKPLTPEESAQIVDTTIYSGMKINNDSSFEIDTAALMSQPLTQRRQLLHGRWRWRISIPQLPLSSLAKMLPLCLTPLRLE